MEFARRLESVQGEMQVALEAALAVEKDLVPLQLYKAMHYALLAPGKRLRPYLIFAVAEIYGLPYQQVLPLAISLECVHCYSLIHDDLPCMDDAGLRRGLPTVHKQFDEATALLAGSALFTLAFKILSEAKDIDAPERCRLMLMLADVSGGQGMISGQMLDLLGENVSYTLAQVEQMQLLKTGALIQFALTAPAILANASAAEQDALRQYAEKIGLAYQIADDLMDLEATAAQSGKTTGLDAVHGKSTFVSLLGVGPARQMLYDLLENARAHINIFAPKNCALLQFTNTIGQY